MQIEMEKVVQFASRTGRQLQRYHLGRRQVVGCIPYRYVRPKRSSSSADMNKNDNSAAEDDQEEEIEVLLISSQKNHTMMLFPKGGWEMDESIEEAAYRESLEEAGVLGTVQPLLGKWSFKSKSQLDTFHDGFIFPLLVQKQLDYWPEKSSRHRKWLKIQQARELCQNGWMKEALDLFVQRLGGNDHVVTRLFPQAAAASSSSGPHQLSPPDNIEPVLPAETPRPLPAFLRFGSEIASFGGVKINHRRDPRIDTCSVPRQMEVSQPC